MSPPEGRKPGSAAPRRTLARLPRCRPRARPSARRHGGDDGAIARYKITDPSFHNWFGLALALRGGQISDFPLCNKSFNLSYSGNDL